MSQAAACIHTRSVRHCQTARNGFGLSSYLPNHWIMLWHLGIGFVSGAFQVLSTKGCDMNPARVQVREHFAALHAPGRKSRALTAIAW
jgi:hypothetical protein